MSIFEIIAILFLLTAVLGLLNARLLRLPDSIGLLVVGLVASVVVTIAEAVFPQLSITEDLQAYVREIDFRASLLDGVLAFLLFAGAIHIDLVHLKRKLKEVGAMALVVTALSTSLVGVGLWLAAQGVGQPVSLFWCLAFGALISPTDPVAVLSTLGRMKLPEELSLLLSGESLFNDGIGIVLFTSLVAVASGAGEPSVAGLVGRFWLEALGGGALGAFTGYVAYRGTRMIDNYSLEVLISLALVTCTYVLAQRFGVSGPIAVVVSGILLGNRGPADAMSAQTQRYFFGLWTLIDQILNAMLFLMIGLEVVVLDFDRSLLWSAAVAIPIVLAARCVSVTLLTAGLSLRREISAGTIPILTWGGLHGGISVALALSLPDGGPKSLFLCATYGVVLFSLIVQGLSLGPMAARYHGQPAAEP